MATKYMNYIDGKWVEAKSRARFENRNPADQRLLIGTFPESGAKDVDLAVKAAQKAADAWRLTPAPKRGEIIMRAGQLIASEKESLAKLMTREMGKVLAETRGDVQEAIDMAYFIAGEGRRLLGETSTTELRDKFAMTVRQPVGVCGLITPWNFPMAIPSWKIFPALICGNTIVFKPGEDTPASAVKFVEILAKAGLPKGVLNLVHGAGETGEAIVHHPDIKLISFTGSSDVGRLVAEHCGRSLKRCSLEMGGKNAQIVLDDADLDLALEGALWGAFGTTGQRCTATSRLYVHKKVFNTFKRRLVMQAKKIKIGNGLKPGVQMGPLINDMQRHRVSGYIGKGITEGAKLECGGKVLRRGDLKYGNFIEPTVFSGVTPEMTIIREEIFGPVVCVVPIKNMEDGIAQLNSSEYGLSSSIYTKDVNKAMKAVRDIEAGITYVNGPTIGAEVHLPFGGVKNTGNGHREAGTAVLDFYSEWKSVYMDYSGKLQKAQIDTN